MCLYFYFDFYTEVFFFFVIHVTCPQAEKNVSSQWRESAIDIRSTSFTFSLPLAVESSCDESVGGVWPKDTTNSSQRRPVRADVETLSFL